MSPKQYWMLKTEPGTFSYTDLERDGWTHWDGVRNHQAKKNLAAMKAEDLALIYHSITDKAIVGVAKITQEAYPDPTDPTGKWVAVRVEPVQSLKKPVTLQEVKAEPALADIALVRQGRLSVMPLTEGAFRYLLEMAETALPATTA